MSVAISTGICIFMYSFYIRYWVNDGMKYQMRVLSRLPIHSVITNQADYKERELPLF